MKSSIKLLCISLPISILAACPNTEAAQAYCGEVFEIANEVAQLRNVPINKEERLKQCINATQSICSTEEFASRRNIMSCARAKGFARELAQAPRGSLKMQQMILDCSVQHPVVFSEPCHIAIAQSGL